MILAIIPVFGLLLSRDQGLIQSAGRGGSAGHIVIGQNGHVIDLPFVTLFMWIVGGGVSFHAQCLFNLDS